MLALLRSANQHFRRLTLVANNFSGRRSLVSSCVRFAEPLAKPNFVFQNSTKSLIRNNSLRAAAMLPEERIVAFDALWKKLLSDSNVDISTLNHYLHTRFESGTPIDFTTVSESLDNSGISPDARTYGIFIQQSCAKGDMEETKKILLALKNAQLEVDPFIFSCILHGYVKAGHPNEVEATKAIMANFGLWPSKIGYMGLLSAYAGLGDLDGFANTVNEAHQVYSLNADSPLPLLTVVGAVSAVRLVVTLANAMPDSETNCSKVFSYLPDTLDTVSTSMARFGIIQLLMNQRPTAALKLFRRTDTLQMADSYFMLLGKAIYTANLDPHLISVFMKIANLPAPRANLIYRRMQMDQKFVRRTPAMSMDDKTVDELFACAKDAEAGVLVHAIVPRLLAHGVSPMNIVETIQPAEMAPVAAFGCVLNRVAPTGVAPCIVPENLEEAKSLCEQFDRLGYFPRKENLQYTLNRCPHLCRCLIGAAELAETNVHEVLRQVIEIFTQCSGPRSEKPVAIRLVSHLYDRACVRPFRRLDPAESRLLDALVDLLIAQDAHFQGDNWLFYALEQLGVPHNKCELLQMVAPTQNKVDVIIHRLEGLLQKDAVRA